MPGLIDRPVADLFPLTTWTSANALRDAPGGTCKGLYPRAKPGDMPNLRIRPSLQRVLYT